MSNEKPLNQFTSLKASLQGGIIGGVAAGLFEVLLVSRWGGNPANLSALLFASIAYGLLGMIAGIGMWIFLQVVPLYRKTRDNFVQMGAIYLSGSLSAILFVIIHFLTFRDFHRELVRHTDPLGIATMIMLLAGALVLYQLVKIILTGLLGSFTTWLLKPKNTILIISLVIVAGIILNISLAKDAESTFSPFDDSGQSNLKQKPCAILIVLDTLRPDYVSCYGSVKASTPNLDKIAGNGIIYEQVYAQATHTKPSTATILTSRYPSEHRAIHKSESLPESVTTLAEVFNQSGYYCGGIVANINLAPVFNYQQGFHEYSYLPPDFFFGANEASARLVIYGVLRLMRLRFVKSVYPYNFYSNAERVYGYFDDFMNRHKGENFFLFLHFMDPHDPYFEHPYSGSGYARAQMENPPPELATSFMEYYRQDIEYLDEQIGLVIDRLKESNLYDNSIIVITSDHGEEFYEHGGWWHANTLHEEQVRVPMIIKYPGNEYAGSVVNFLTRSIDIPPTILKSCDVPVPAEMRGEDLFNVDPENSGIIDAFAECDHGGNSIRMLRVGPWKYIKTDPESRRKRPPEQLFNLDSDPFELNNLFDSEPEKATEMKFLLQAKYQQILASRESGSAVELDPATQERLRALGYTQ
ncbi:hypothetical protein CEE37_03340 [candidate division LCP-89 bacterium B3_LCP]|uniref:Sulfatase N-terminal domain-containing protein n=1 Tax=candidate division LCP-89 bacterium B3_LCP TaxID=2012998 RepID=A0A532V325_UNCL8|nr:MAG: hypothetical protein CEE37_03340 [candidate division LCP-89 bacterium B3_LCP]